MRDCVLPRVMQAQRGKYVAPPNGRSLIDKK